MRNIFLFIRRYFNLLLFLVLQGLSIYLIVSYSKYHHSLFGHTANIVTGNINKKYNEVQYYFHLKDTNDSLLSANEKLYNKADTATYSNFSSVKESTDTIKIDSSRIIRRFTYYGAKIVANSVGALNNYIVLYGSNVSSFTPQMAVVDPNNNVIGAVREVDGNYAVVMSLLHKDSRLSALLKNSGETGTLSWDGLETNMLTLTGIPKGVQIKKGDSLLTSGMSTTFPRGLLLGRVDVIIKEKETNSLKIMVRTAANFNTLQYGYVISDAQKTTIDRLIEKNSKASN